MPDIQIRVGAIVGTSLAAAMAPEIDAAKRARKVIQSEAEAGAAAQSKAADKAAKAAAKAYEQIVSASEKAAAKEQAAADKASAAKQRAELKAFDAKLRAGQRAADEYEKNLNKEIAAAERAAQKKIAIAEREAKAEERAAQSAGRDRYGFARSAGGTFGRIAGAAGRLGLGVAKAAGVNFDVSSVIGNVVQQQKLAAQIANSGYLEGDARNGVRQSGTDLHHEARAAALGAGLSTSDTLEGLQQMVGKSSDLATSRAILGDMAKLAAATGANMSDVGAAAGEIALRLGDVPNKAKLVSTEMSIIAQQGKVGAIEIREMGKSLGKVMASAGQFREGPEQAMKDLGALYQVAKKGGADARGSATGVQSFVAGLTSKSGLKTLQKLGVNPFDNEGLKQGDTGWNTKLADPGKIIAAALFKTHGDLGKLGSTFANVRTMSIIRGANGIYSSAEASKKGSGSDAIKDYLANMGKGMSSEDLQASLATSMGTTGSRANNFNTKLEEIGEKLGDKLFPALEKLEPVVLRLADTFTKIVGVAVDNPGATIVAAITGSIAKAGIGDAIKSLLTGGGGGAGGGAGGLGGAAVAGAALGTGLTIAAQEAAKATVDQHGDAQDQVQEILAKAKADRKAGRLSKEGEIAIQRQAGLVTDLNSTTRNAELSQGLGGLFNYETGTISAQQYSQGSQDVDALPALKATQEAQLAALKSLASGVLTVKVVNMPAQGMGTKVGTTDQGDGGEEE